MGPMHVVFPKTCTFPRLFAKLIFYETLRYNYFVHKTLRPKSPSLPNHINPLSTRTFCFMICLNVIFPPTLKHPLSGFRTKILYALLSFLMCVKMSLQSHSSLFNYHSTSWTESLHILKLLWHFSSLVFLDTSWMYIFLQNKTPSHSTQSNI
jgi:hypothetical protein